MAFFFPLVRLVRDETFGFIPEVVTRKRFELMQYEYAAAELAGFWYENKLGFMPIKLPDLWHDWYDMTALLPTRAMPDFRYILKDFHAERRIDIKEKDAQTGYSWSPIGQTQGFGYEAPIDAWLIAHPGGSVFITRSGDEEFEPYFHKWCEHWIEQPVPREWAKPCDELAELIVPSDMRKVQAAARSNKSKSLYDALFR